jgi:hypothetical protein
MGELIQGNHLMQADGIPMVPVQFSGWVRLTVSNTIRKLDAGACDLDAL